MFEKVFLDSESVVYPQGYCSSSQCKKGCNGDSGSAINDVQNDNTPEDPCGY